MTSDVDTAPLVGRAAALQTLHTALLDVEQGVTSAVFVTGESGVGKTRLLTEACAEMRRANAVVLSGACLDIGDASPLHPLVQALRRYAAESARAGPAGANIGGPAAPVRELLELLDGGATDPDGAGALLERLSRGLGRLCGARPLVLVLDDLQWVDRTTRQLLLYLLAGLTDIRLLVLAAVRTEHLRGGDPMRRVLAELRRLRSVRVLELPPLSRAETEQLTAAIIGGPLAPDSAELLWKRSGGNPFVVEELARDTRDGRVGLSDTLREIFLGRVDALPPPARTVVHAVAAGVEPVGHALLARVVPLDEDELIAALRSAVAQRILVGADDGYRLRHRLVAEVLEHELLPVERASLHRRYAEAIAAAPGGDSEHARLAHHWRLAGQRRAAFDATVAAAREAERLLGFAEAHGHFSTALRLVDERPAELPDVDRAALWEQAAEAAHRCGEHTRALELLEASAAGQPQPPASALRIRRARYLAAAGRSTDAEAEYERALADPDCTPDLRASAAARLAELLLHLGRYADAGRRARHALELASVVRDATSEVVLASAALGFSQAYLEDPDAGLASVRAALRTAEETGRPDDVGCAYLHLAELMTGPLNQLEEGVVVARRGAERAAGLGLGRTYGTRLLAIAATGLFRVGQWAEAEKVIAAALRSIPSGTDAVELLLARCRLSVGYGEFDAADRDLDAVTTLLAGGGARHVMPLLTLRAGLAMWRGEHAQARQAVREGLAETRSDDVWLLATLAWHGLRAEAEAHAGQVVPVDPEAVAHLREVVNRVARRSDSAAGPVRDTVAGYRELCDAELSRVEGRSDARSWARAAAAWQRRKNPYPVAYARLRQAEALFAQRTRNAAATTVLREAYQVAQGLGARPLCTEIKLLASRARVSLEDRGLATVPAPRSGATGPAAPVAGSAANAPAGGPPGAQRSPVAGSALAGRGGSGARGAELLGTLTARELEVLAGVAEGLTNREIARRLFISERTVGVHVSHILDKLQVRSRVQASGIYLLSSRPGAGT
jgi:DNA-binding CsgD family transcriptional regulator/tetratricopeptide (TPR) repeat protein